VSTLLESVLMLEGICIGIVVGFEVHRSWWRGKKKTLLDRLGRNSSNI
jgi:predicted membrane protein